MAMAVACAMSLAVQARAGSSLPRRAAPGSRHCACDSISRAPRTSSSNSSSRGRHRRQRAVAAAAPPGPSSQRLAVSSTFEQYILDLQKRIIQGAEELDGSGAKFQHDRWTRSPSNPNAGFGITSVLEGGSVLEKAAANISVVAGVLSHDRAKAMSSRGRGAIDPAGGQSYSAAAMSLVFHSAHPFIPTLRADVRLFEVEGQLWYGGGCDLTPFYIFDEDVREFHAFWKQLCDRHDSQIYPELKEWCDRYFYIPARQEHRGVGGLFFDDLEAASACYDVEEFVRDVGDGILPSWAPIVARRRGQPFSAEQRQWQLVRRGRYLEFNLLYDRGVKFGLDGGRVESIMVSAPPLIAWRYNVQPAAGSEEERLVEVLRQPREWV